MPLTLVKAHALGNDFILLETSQLDFAHAEGTPGRAALARALCERHRGCGGDGVIFYTSTPRGASMRLLNADGSRSEVSGNGVRCLAAWLAAERGARAGTVIEIDTEAGTKPLELLAIDGGRMTFRAGMGHPEAIARVSLVAGGQPVEAVTLRVGNPQCVVLGDVTAERLHSLASALAVHPHFPEGTNVELAAVEDPRRVRILIWERGVGPTEASGTGACASAVAAITYGGAERDVAIVSPGGTQRVEWTGDGLFLTGWADVILRAEWLLERKE
jgi:diaminopimelate epimerase